MDYNTRKRLFLGTLADLETKSQSNDPYEVLGISALLRKLLLDSHPMIDQVNKGHRLTIRLTIADPDTPYRRAVLTHNPRFFTVADGIDPEVGFPNSQIVSVTRDRFLSTPVLFVQGHDYSIRDVILFAAHVMGGVHAGSPKTEKDRTLTVIEQRYLIGGLPVALRQLRSIAKIVSLGLAPLRAAIAADIERQQG
jgi:hypothetical protein